MPRYYYKTACWTPTNKSFTNTFMLIPKLLHCFSTEFFAKSRQKAHNYAKIDT